MPVTARLSQKFYERFGDDIAGEFVGWFNAVDSAYQLQLRDLNDLNWERFKSEMDARFAQSEAKLTEKLAQSEARLTDRITRVEVQLTGKLSDMKGDLMKWMFIFWSGSVLPLGGVVFMLLRHTP